MLKKQNRLNNLTRKKNQLFTFPLFNLRVSDNRETTARFAFIVSKKIDKRAVVRNRTKRVLRSAVDEIIGRIGGGKNIVIISKKSLTPSQKEEVSGFLQAAFRKISILE